MDVGASLASLPKDLIHHPGRGSPECQDAKQLLEVRPCIPSPPHLAMGGTRQQLLRASRMASLTKVKRPGATCRVPIDHPMAPAGR